MIAQIILSEIVILLWLFLFLLNALLSSFLTTYHVCHRYQSQCYSRLPNLNVPYFQWHWMSSLDIYIYIYVSLKPETIKILKLWVSFWGCSTWISTRSCVSLQYTTHFSVHSMQAMAICSRNGSSCLNCRISRVLESWPFWCELLMHLCMVALWLFNKDQVCWHILLTSITYLPLQRRCMECSSFIIFH